MRFITNIIDNLVLCATFWRKTVKLQGIRISMRDASPHMRTSLQYNYEAEDIRLCKKLFTPEDKILELGSSIGFLALYCLTQIKVEKFAMVEANPSLKSLIDENFALNGQLVPDFIQAAAGACDGTVTFNISRDSMSSSVLNRPNTCESITVPQMEIPSLVKKLSFTPNALIMDIEGAEAGIPLEHFAPFKKILAEFHPNLVGQERIDGLLNGLKQMGFQVVARDRRSVALSR